MKHNLAYSIASYFGVGFAPFAPGTAGSFMTLPLVAAAAYFFGLWGILAVAAAAFVLGWPATHYVVTHQKVEDPGWVVVDEVVGQTLSFVLVSPLLYANLSHWYIYLVGFAFFRLFDIKKMGPVKWSDSKLHSALGVMLDDVFAGLFAAVCTYNVAKIFVV